MSLPPFPSEPGGESAPDGPVFPPSPARRPVRTTLGQRILIAVAAVVAVALPVAGVSYAVGNLPLIRDRIAVASFTPTAAITQLVARSGMNDTGEFLFFTAAPQLNSAAEFNTACGVRPEQFLLGCFTGTSIHLYDVTEERLDGLREVTAAHEMLHAGFYRLDPASQERLGVLLEEAYTAHGDDPDLADRMAAYQVSQPGTRLTELHSIIGTEFSDLSPELEGYYSRYFSDRSIVVDLHAAYQKVFSDLQARVAELSAQILALADEVDAQMTGYNADMTALNSDIEAFIAKNESFGYSGDQSGFDADKSGLMARSDELRARLAAITTQRTQLGDLQQQLRDLDADAQALNRSIDSTFVPGEGI